MSETPATGPSPAQGPAPAAPEAFFNRLSPVVIILALAVAGMEVVLQLAEHGLIGGPEAIGWRMWLVQHFSFHSAAFDHILVHGINSANLAWPFLTYPFIQPGVPMAVVGLAFLLGMGKAVTDSYSSLAFVILFVAGSISGALAHGLVLDSARPLMGVLPPVFAIIAAYTWDDLMRRGRRNQPLWPAFRLIGLMLILRGGMWLLLGSSGEILVSELGAFVVGFGLSIVLARDGKARMRRLLERLRQR